MFARRISSALSSRVLIQPAYNGTGERIDQSQAESPPSSVSGSLFKGTKPFLSLYFFWVAIDNFLLEIKKILLEAVKFDSK